MDQQPTTFSQKILLVIGIVFVMIVHWPLDEVGKLLDWLKKKVGFAAA